MIAITPTAQAKLTAYLAQCHAAPEVRVCAPSCGVAGGGDMLTLAIGAPGPGDETAQAGELTLSMARPLATRVGAVTIDYQVAESDEGFTVSSEFPLDCDGCTDCCE